MQQRCSTLTEERRSRKPPISVIFNFNPFLHDIKRVIFSWSVRYFHVHPISDVFQGVQGC